MQCLRCLGRSLLSWFCLVWVLTTTMAGCSPRGGNPGRSAGGEVRQQDAFQLATVEAKPKDRPYLDAAKPVVTSIVARDYASFYGTLSSHARASSNPHQYVTPLEENPKPQADLRDLTVDQFVEWMKKMEAARGLPTKINHVYVESTDPKILAGQGEGFEKIDVMLAIGAMPKEIPADIRRASVRAQIQCNLSEDQLKYLAEHQNTTVDEIRKQQAEEEDEEERGTYLNLKFVLVEENGSLKVGYFEFMPPSMLD